MYRPFSYLHKPSGDDLCELDHYQRLKTIYNVTLQDISGDTFYA